MNLAFGRMLFVLGVMATLCSPAFSAVVSYDTPVSWQANVDSIVTDNFDSNGPGTAVYYGGGYTNPGVFTLSVSSFGTLYNYYLPGSPYYDYGSQGIMRGPANDNGTAFVTVTLLAGATAFALELMSAPDGQPVSVTINNDMAETYIVSTLPKPGHEFIGFTSTDPITTVTLSSAAGIDVVFDHLSVATAKLGGVDPGPDPGATPEASTLLLCGSGLLAAGFLRRRCQS